MSGFLFVGVFGILILFVAIGILIAYIHNRDHRIVLENRLLKTQIETREQVQKELSEEIHDNVGQLLSSTKLLLGVTERTFQSPPQTLIAAQETLGKAITELRALTKSLNIEWLNQFNLIENLKIEIQRITAAGTVSINYLPDGISIPLDASRQLTLFRMIQEALNNIIKHGNASMIHVEFFDDLLMFKTIIKDDGTRFEVEKNAGLGIVTMNNRAKLLNGTFYWEKKLAGNSLVINIPIHETT